MEKSNRGGLLYTALLARYDGEIKQAVATQSIYFENTVGIGEHPQHQEEMDK